MGRTPRSGFRSVVSSLVVHFFLNVSVSTTEIKYKYKPHVFLPCRMKLDLKLKEKLLGNVCHSAISTWRRNNI